MKDHFTCSICGQEHDGFVTDQAYTLPDLVWAIPEPERSEKAHFDDDLCSWANRFFIRCVLSVPFTDALGEFGWGAWAEVDRSVFQLYIELWDKDGSSGPVYEGFLANHLPTCEHSLGTPVLVRFKDPASRPSLHLRPDDTSRLGIEQRDGIDVVRYHEILTVIAPR